MSETTITSLASYKRQLKLWSVASRVLRVVDVAFIVGLIVSVVGGVAWTFGSILAMIIGVAPDIVRWVGLFAMIFWIAFSLGRARRRFIVDDNDGDAA